MRFIKGLMSKKDTSDDEEYEEYEDDFDDGDDLHDESEEQASADDEDWDDEEWEDDDEDWDDEAADDEGFDDEPEEAPKPRARKISLGRGKKKEAKSSASSSGEVDLDALSSMLRSDDQPATASQDDGDEDDEHDWEDFDYSEEGDDFDDEDDEYEDDDYEDDDEEFDEPAAARFDDDEDEDEDDDDFGGFDDFEDDDDDGDYEDDDDYEDEDEDDYEDDDEDDLESEFGFADDEDDDEDFGVAASAAPPQRGGGRKIWDIDQVDSDLLQPRVKSERPPYQAQAAEDEPAPRRAGRVKTRLLGFQQAAAEPDIFEAAEPETSSGGDVTFPVGWIVVVEGPGRGAFFTLTNGVAQIGRGKDQTVRLDFGDNSISRQNHAAVAFDEELGQFFLGHGGKSNLVRLNNRPVLSTEDLSDGDLIRIGETTLKFVALCGESFSWREDAEDDLNYAAAT